MQRILDTEIVPKNVKSSRTLYGDWVTVRGTKVRVVTRQYRVLIENNTRIATEQYYGLQDERGKMVVTPRYTKYQVIPVLGVDFTPRPLPYGAKPIDWKVAATLRYDPADGSLTEPKVKHFYRTPGEENAHSRYLLVNFFNGPGADVERIDGRVLFQARIVDSQGNLIREIDRVRPFNEVDCVRQFGTFTVLSVYDQDKTKLTYMLNDRFEQVGAAYRDVEEFVPANQNLGLMLGLCVDRQADLWRFLADDGNFRPSPGTNAVKPVGDDRLHVDRLRWARHLYVQTHTRFAAKAAELAKSEAAAREAARRTRAAAKSAAPAGSTWQPIKPCEPPKPTYDQRTGMRSDVQALNDYTYGKTNWIYTKKYEYPR